MFDISAIELMVIAIVAIVVIGPKDLPDMLRNLGRFVRKLRMMAGDFQRQMDQAGFEDVRKSIEEVRSLTSPTGVIARTISSALEETDKKTVTTQKAVAPTEPAPAVTEDASRTTEVDAGDIPAGGGEATPAAALATPSGEETVTTIARVSVAHDPQPAPMPAAALNGAATTVAEAAPVGASADTSLAEMRTQAPKGSTASGDAGAPAAKRDDA